jgi:ABC-2 type transport system ATP-binding protein
MIHDPAVMVLDEPAAGLDPRARIELREMIRQLAADGKTILVSSHILTELAEMCDVVGIIEQGRILAVGTVDAINQAHRTQRQVRVRVLGGASGVAAWITMRDDATVVSSDGETLVFSHTGDDQREADLLAAMIGAGFRVAAFDGHRQSLEDVFLKVTRGAVQ